MLDNKTVELFNTAFEAMGEKVKEFGVAGNGVAAYLADENSVDWKMTINVFGKIVIPASDDDPGWNLIGMSCSKAAESIITHVVSGKSPRPLMHGEVGFQGAAVEKFGNGYVVAAFGGAADEQDFAIAQAGVAAMIKKLS